MSAERTQQALSNITDEGLFERFATAILREANQTYHSLAHTGVNVAGKTVKAPLDGICFVPGADPPHMIAVHHTTTARNDLKKKWLHDPSKVRPRKKSQSTAPAGDLIKTAELAMEERTRTPNLRVTLVLTTNKEPDQSLVRAVAAAGYDRGLEIDLWPSSRLSHFLDNPAGQWIRCSFLGIDQEQLSTELLHELSKKSLEIHNLPDNPNAWVSRSLDAILTTSMNRDVTFLVAGSGLGKSVACYRRLAVHIEGGGFGIILSHAEVASATTLDQAVTTTLCKLHPPLALPSTSALSFCSPERPLLLVVEDINRSGQTQFLVEKLASWSHTPSKDSHSEFSRWRLVCPLWPENLSSLREDSRKRIEPLIITAGGFTKSEGRNAVLARARLEGRELSSLSAEAISHALGHDPLLIALHDQCTTPDPQKIISQFVKGSLSRAAAVYGDLPAAEYHQVLRALAGGMLSNRQIELNWIEVSDWAGLQGEPVRLLGRLAHQGELIRFSDSSDDQQLLFRHDRVRDWLLADAAGELARRDLLAEQVVAEPYFTEVMGAVLVWGNPKPNFLPRVASSNPLALFHALRVFGQASKPHHHAILQAINDWLDNPATHDQSNLHLRMEALSMLAGTDSPEVPALVRKFSDRTTSAQLARLRNGDLSGGIELCIHLEPGSGAPWRDIQLEHAKLHYGRSLTKALDSFLRRTDLHSAFRIGALRLAGHIASPRLALAIEACWTSDDKRSDHLAEYLWAFGECCGDDPARHLEPVCNAWAALSNQPDNQGLPSPRDSVAEYELRWAFHRWPPLSAIDFFVQRGSQDDLKWPIFYMLHGMDHPKAVLFVAETLATTHRRLEGTGSFSHLAMTAKDDWQRNQEHGCPMSKVSRNLLLDLWRDETKDKHLRLQAFSLWAATQDSGDIEVLRAVPPTVELADKILWARLTRGDQQAIPAMIEKLQTDDHSYWWQCGRYLWSPELTEALDEFLGRRGDRAKRTWGESFASDWITSELIIQLPESQGERLLLKHWRHLRFVSDFVQAALYHSTPSLMEAAKSAINECPEPTELMKYLSSRFGINTRNRQGLIREAQIYALAPYLHLLSAHDIGDLWWTCNRRGWFVIRQELLDSHLKPPYLKFKWDKDKAFAELDEMVIEKRHVLWIHDWIDDFMKTGVLWSEIIKTMAVWLDQRRSLEALQYVATAIMHRGTREDLKLLRSYEGMPEHAAKDLIKDTQFSVRRHSIH